MIRNDQIQAALIDKLQATSDITDRVSSAEIREDQWAGAGFSYPNIRVQLRPSTPVDGICSGQSFDASILVFSESSSSLEADQIAGIIAQEFSGDDDKGTGFIVNTLQFYLRVTSLVPALRSATNECRAEVMLRGTVS